MCLWTGVRLPSPPQFCLTKENNNMKTSELYLWQTFYNSNGHLSIAWRVTKHIVFVLNYNGSFYDLKITEKEGSKYKPANISAQKFFQNLPKEKFYIRREKKKLLEAIMSKFEKDLQAKYLSSMNPSNSVVHQVIKQGLDPHTWIAAKMFNVFYSEVTEDQRQVGKQYNFFHLYDGSTGLAPDSINKRRLFLIF